LAYPERTLQCLKILQEEYPCTFIRGNKEDYWIDHRAGKHTEWVWKNKTSSSGMLKYSYDRLSDDQIDAFSSMPIMKVMKYDGMPDFVICHGSPFKVNESLREDYDYIDDLTKKLETELTICGHFHIQTEYTRNGKRVINPGAVGVSLRSGGKAQFMMLYGDNGGWTPELISVEYDVNDAIREMDEEQLFIQAPAFYKIIKAILHGQNVTVVTVLTKAGELYKKYEGNNDWREIPEKYWNMALDEFGI